MKKFIAFITVASAIVSLASCNKAENEQPVQPAERELVNTPLVLTANVPDEGVKTTLENNSEVYWQETDTFYGFINGGAQVLTFVFDGLVNDDPKCANFICNEPHYAIQAGDALTCVYGCELSANNLPVWPEQQLATKTGTRITGTATRNISAVPMFAYGVADSDGVFGELGFKNGGGLVQINVLNNTRTNIYPNDLYIAANETICGEFNLPSFIGDEPSFTFTSNAKKQLKWTYNDTKVLVVADSTVAIPLNVAVPARTYTGLKFTYTGRFNDIPYGFNRTLKNGQSITINRSQIDQITMKLYGHQKLDPINDPVGTIGLYLSLQDPHHKGGRNGMLVGFDFSDMTGNPKSKLIIATANVVMNGKHEEDDMEYAWNVGSLMTYQSTGSHTSGGHWRLMTKTEAEAVMSTDEHGTGQARWGTMTAADGTSVQGIYWYFDPERYSLYNATVVPNSIFLPVTHTGEGGRAEGRYWLDGDYYFEFWQDTTDLTKGVVSVINAKEVSASDKLGALRLVHDAVAQN